MDFTTFIIIIGVLGVLSAIGSVLWWILIIWLGVRTWRMVARRLDAQAVDLNRLITQAASASGPGRVDLERLVAQRLAAFNTQTNSLDALHRQQYELKVAELQSYAASNGLIIDLSK